ncbi:hypothetical protein QBC45DRAFT_376252, partial [Copromyces sp. CBS 386.78]
ETGKKYPKQLIKVLSTCTFGLQFTHPFYLEPFLPCVSYLIFFFPLVFLHRPFTRSPLLFLPLPYPFFLQLGRYHRNISSFTFWVLLASYPISIHFRLCAHNP